MVDDETMINDIICVNNETKVLQRAISESIYS